MKRYTNKELVEIYKNLKTSAKILGFSSASDSEMIAEIELEAVKRHLNLIDGTVEETAAEEKAEGKTYVASVTNKETKAIEVITNSGYTNKKDFAHDLRANGYSVKFISTPEKFDEDCESYWQKIEARKYARIVAKQHKTQDEEQTIESTSDEISEVETTEQAQESKDTFEYRNYIISGNERTGIIAIDNHGNFSPNVYRTVEEAKKAVDEDIECAERKYAEMEAEKQAEPVDYSKFFVERGAEDSIVRNDNGIFEVVLGHTEDNHALLSVTESGKYEYDVAVYRIDKHGNVDSVPVESAHFKNFGSCRRYYKTIMNKFIGDDHLADKNRKHSAGVKRHSLLGMLAGAK